jgi:HSP20 family protein
MELAPWRPLRELSTFRREMDGLWDRVFGGEPFSRRFVGKWSPTVDVSEAKNELLVKVELPGLEAKDIEISISGDLLNIKGEKKKEEEEKDEHHHYDERYYGAFERSLKLPFNVKTEKVETTFDKGVLKIKLPKAEEAEKKEIKIEINM